MATTKDFENILSDCLDRVIRGKTIESCLKSYPQYAAELEPLLKTAQDTITAADVKPRPEFRQRAAYEFQAAIREMPAKKQGWSFRWQLRFVLPVAVVVVLLAAGSGTVVAATNALPDSPLYSIKMATEQVQLTFTFSSEGKAELYSRFIDYRVEEILKMVENGDLASIATATERMNGQLTAINDLGLVGNRSNVHTYGWDAFLAAEQTQTPPSPSSPDDSSKQGGTTTTTTETTTATVTDTDMLIQHLLDEMEHNVQLLQEQMENASVEVQGVLQDAINVIQTAYSQIINSLQ